MKCRHLGTSNFSGEENIKIRGRKDIGTLPMYLYLYRSHDNQALHSGKPTLKIDEVSDFIPDLIIEFVQPTGCFDKDDLLTFRQINIPISSVSLSTHGHGAGSLPLVWIRNSMVATALDSRVCLFMTRLAYFCLFWESLGQASWSSGVCLWRLARGLQTPS